MNFGVVGCCWGEFVTFLWAAKFDSCRYLNLFYFVSDMVNQLSTHSLKAIDMGVDKWGALHNPDVLDFLDFVFEFPSSGMKKYGNFFENHSILKRNRGHFSNFKTDHHSLPSSQSQLVYLHKEMTQNKIPFFCFIAISNSIFSHHLISCTIHTILNRVHTQCV